MREVERQDGRRARPCAQAPRRPPDRGRGRCARRRAEPHPRRVVPAIEQGLPVPRTRIERYIGRLLRRRATAATSGAHRDNTTKGTAHRRFAVTINLNAGEFEGGELRFPEFGPRTYRPPTGGAVVFSCSLLHEAPPVTARPALRLPAVPLRRGRGAPPDRQQSPSGRGRRRLPAGRRRPRGCGGRFGDGRHQGSRTSVIAAPWRQRRHWANRPVRVVPDDVLELARGLEPFGRDRSAAELDDLGAGRAARWPGAARRS